jgi:ketosteroid isomerase-like protein
MTPNQRTVERYMDGFRRTDREPLLSCLTEDVRWLIPGVFDVQGKDGFEGHIVDEGFADRPEITVTRVVETSDVVVAEGFVRAPRTDGTVLHLVFCDVFEMWDAKIRSLTSYLMETK